MLVEGVEIGRGRRSGRDRRSQPRRTGRDRRCDTGFSWVVTYGDPCKEGWLDIPTTPIIAASEPVESRLRKESIWHVDTNKLPPWYIYESG